MNSVAASPALVSALHALQKRCRQLEEDNQVLRENVAKESRAHADSRGTYQFASSKKCVMVDISSLGASYRYALTSCPAHCIDNSLNRCQGKIERLEKSCNEKTEELSNAHDEIEVIRKQGLVLRKEMAMLNEALESTRTENQQNVAKAADLDAQAQALRVELDATKRPAMVDAAVQTDNRREEELMDLMRRFDPQLLKDAFEAELSLERERSAWLEQQLNQTRQTLHSLAEKVNKNSTDESVSLSVNRKPRFMWSTKSVRGRHSKYSNANNQKRPGKKGSKRGNIHKTLIEANLVRACTLLLHTQCCIKTRP